MSDISSGTSSSRRSSAGAGGTVTEELFCKKCKIPLANEEKEAHREWHKAIKRQALVGRRRGPQVSGAPTSYERPKTASPRCARPPVKKHVDSPRPPVKGNKASKEEKELLPPSSRPRTRAAAAAGIADDRATFRERGDKTSALE